MLTGGSLNSLEVPFPMRLASESRALFVVGLLAASAVMASGCQSRAPGTPDLAPVTGTVTVDGQPADKASVSFEGPDNKVSFGNTDTTGRYELNYIHQLKGAAIGANTVKITTRIEAPPGAGYVDPIPAKYNARTTLKADVKAGPNVINFELTTKKE
jgi:hypothetical protein